MAKWFKEGRDIFQDEDRSDKLTMASTSEMVDSFSADILSKWSVKIQSIYEQLNISVGTAHKIVYDDHYFSNVSWCWFPKMLTLENKQECSVIPINLIWNSCHISLDGQLSSIDEFKNTARKWLKTHSKDFYQDKYKKPFFRRDYIEIYTSFVLGDIWVIILLNHPYSLNHTHTHTHAHTNTHTHTHIYIYIYIYIVSPIKQVFLFLFIGDAVSIIKNLMTVLVV